QRFAQGHVHAERVGAIPVELQSDLVAAGRHGQALEYAVEVVGDPGVVVVHVDPCLLGIHDHPQRAAVGVAAVVVIRRVSVGAAVVERRIAVGAVQEGIVGVVVVVPAVVVRRAVVVVVVAVGVVVAGARARPRMASLGIRLGRRGIGATT